MKLCDIVGYLLINPPFFISTCYRPYPLYLESRRKLAEGKWTYEEYIGRTVGEQTRDIAGSLANARLQCAFEEEEIIQICGHVDTLADRVIAKTDPASASALSGLHRNLALFSDALASAAISADDKTYDEIWELCAVLCGLLVRDHAGWSNAKIKYPYAGIAEKAIGNSDTISPEDLQCILGVPKIACEYYSLKKKERKERLGQLGNVSAPPDILRNDEVLIKKADLCMGAALAMQKGGKDAETIARTLVFALEESENNV